MALSWGAHCRRVMTVPGIGPVISSAMVAAIGSGAAFAKGRDFSAWLGLVPKQMSTGDRTILGTLGQCDLNFISVKQMDEIELLQPVDQWIAVPEVSVTRRLIHVRYDIRRHGNLAWT